MIYFISYLFHPKFVFFMHIKMECDFKGFYVTFLFIYG